MVHKPQRTDGATSGQARTPDSGPGGERIAKALARAGVASRREVERYIAEGRVALNGQVLTTPAVKVAPGDILTVDGKVVSDAEPARLFRYHKPVGLMTSHKDPQGRPTVFEALPEGLPRLISIGRLDINSEGLLLLTNDGGLARALELPTTGIVRRYRARARGRVNQAKLDALKDGITVEGVQYGPIEAHLDKAKEGPQGANLWITVTLAEGKNREVRRVLEALGLQVNRLIRLAYGPLALGTLNPGEIEEVGPRVIREQLADHIALENLPTGDRVQFKASAAGPAGPRRGAVQIERGNLRQEGRPARYSPANRRRGGSTSNHVQGPGEGAPAADPRKAAEKKAYKPGWAKPKPSGGRPAGPGSKAARGKAVGPRSPAFRATETRLPEPWEARPAPTEKPRGAGPKGPRPAKAPGFKSTGYKGSNPKAGPAKPGGKRAPSDAPYVPKTGAARRTDFAKRPASPSRPGGPKPPRR